MGVETGKIRAKLIGSCNENAKRIVICDESWPRSEAIDRRSRIVCAVRRH